MVVPPGSNSGGRTSGCTLLFYLLDAICGTYALLAPHGLSLQRCAKLYEHGAHSVSHYMAELSVSQLTGG